MGKTILRRLGYLIITMVLVSIVVFLISEVVPIDIARNILGQFATDEAIAALQEELGLNCPPVARYFIWFFGDGWVENARDFLGSDTIPGGCSPDGVVRKGLIRGDMGKSTVMGGDVAPYIMRRLKNSLILAGIAFVLIMPISLFFGVLAGLKEGGILDRSISIISLLTTSTPSFALGVILVVVFAYWLEWLPGISAFINVDSPLQNPIKLVMPVIVLFFAEAGYVARMTRASMVTVMDKPYIRTALLKGVPRWKVVFKHALRNALLAPITVIMLHINWLIGGIVVVEMLFGYQGLGSAILTASLNKDLYVLEAGALVMTFIAVSSQLIADLIYIYLNPRLRNS